MAFSPIENKYLSALTAVQFPSEPIEPDRPMAPGQRPGDVMVAEVGSRGLPEQAYSGRSPDTMQSFDPTVRQRLADYLQSSFESLGMDRYKARKNAQTLIGGPSSNLPFDTGLADFAPYLGTTMQLEESGNMLGDAVSSAKRGDYGTAALQTGGAALGLVPGGLSTAQATRKLAPKLLPKAAEMTMNALEKSGMPARGLGIVEPGPGGMQGPVLNRQEKAVISAGAGRKQGVRQEATDVATNLKSNYSETDGWAPIEINKVEQKFDKAGKYIKVEVEPKAIAYDFHTPPEDVPVEAWQATMSSRVLDEVQTVVDRAAGGDKAALDILAEASWYRTMRDRLRTEFGGLGDVFADVLGTTSAQTDVRQNFKNAITVLTKFSRGDYDQTLAAYESRVAKGQPVDPETLIALDKSGDFDLIKSDAGKLFNTNSPATMGALMDMFRSIKAGDSPKTPNFTGNLIGLTNEATIDVWAARMLRRLADLPRIPPPAEKGVGGAHSKGSII